MIRTTATFVLWALISPALADKPVTPSGNEATDTREIATFTAIELKIAANVTVTIGKPSALTIQADENILKVIETKVVDGTLVISAKQSFKAKKSPQITVSTAKLSAAAVAGSGDLNIIGLDAKTFSLSVSGSADVRLSGKTGMLSLSVIGSADVLAGELEARSASVSVKGSGDAEVFVTETLTASIVGSGDISYKGNPKVTSTVLGSGDIRKRG